MRAVFDAATAGLAGLGRRDGDDHRPLALEDRFRRRAERQPAIVVGAQRIAGLEGAGDGADHGEFVGGHDAEHAELVVAELADLLIIVPAEHCGEVRDAEAHLGTEHRREKFARDVGDVDGLGRIEAIVAIAARLGGILAEVAQQDRAATGRGLDEGGKRVEPVALGRAAGFLNLAFDAAAGAREILGAPEQPRLGGVAVTPGAAGLLVIGLDRLGNSGVGDEAHVGLVDPHPEGDRCGHDHFLRGDEGGLVAAADGGFEPGVIGQCGAAAGR